MKANFFLLSLLIILFASCEEKVDETINESSLLKSSILMDNNDRKSDEIKFELEGSDLTLPSRPSIDWDANVDVGDVVPDIDIDIDGSFEISKEPLGSLGDKYSVSFTNDGTNYNLDMTSIFAQEDPSSFYQTFVHFLTSNDFQNSVKDQAAKISFDNKESAGTLWDVWSDSRLEGGIQDWYKGYEFNSNTPFDLIFPVDEVINNDAQPKRISIKSYQTFIGGEYEYTFKAVLDDYGAIEVELVGIEAEYYRNPEENYELGDIDPFTPYKQDKI